MVVLTSVQVLLLTLEFCSVSFIVYPLLLHRPTSTQFYNIYLFPLTLDIVATADAFFPLLFSLTGPTFFFTNLFFFFLFLASSSPLVFGRALYRDVYTAGYARSDNLNLERPTYFLFHFHHFSSGDREGNHIQRCVGEGE